MAHSGKNRRWEGEIVRIRKKGPGAEGIAHGVMKKKVEVGMRKWEDERLAAVEGNGTCR